MTMPIQQFLLAGAKYSNISLEENGLFANSIAAINGIRVQFFIGKSAKWHYN